MPFEYWIICNPDNFLPFEYWTSPVFRWLLYQACWVIEWSVDVQMSNGWDLEWCPKSDHKNVQKLFSFHMFGFQKASQYWTS